MEKPRGSEVPSTDGTARAASIREGAGVYGADGQKFGEVAAVYRHYLIVERGFFFPRDYFVPLDAVEYHEGDRVYLMVPTDLALSQGWDNPPAEAAAARRSTRGVTTERAGESNRTRVTNGTAASTAAPYPDTYAVGTNTDSYGVIGQPNESDESSGVS